MNGTDQTAAALVGGGLIATILVVLVVLAVRGLLDGPAAVTPGGRTMPGGSRTLLGGAAVALVAVSLAPWFRYDVDCTGPNGPRVQSSSADAWHGSSLWAATIVLAVLAAALGVAGTRARGERTRDRALVAGVVLALLAAGGWLRQAWDLAHPPPIGPGTGTGTGITAVLTQIPRCSALAALPTPNQVVGDEVDVYASMDGAGQAAAALVGGGLVATILVVLVVLAVRSDVQ